MVVLSFDHRVCFVVIIFGKRSDLPFSRKTDRKKEKSMILFTHKQNIIRSQTRLDEIAHEQTVICEQLFADHVVESHQENFASSDYEVYLLVNV